MKAQIKDLITLRSGYLPYNKAVKIQDNLKRLYKQQYKPRHSEAFYYRLIIKEQVGEIKETHPQNSNHCDMVYECFSVVSQHVYGVTPEHCLAQVYDAVKQRRERIRKTKQLPVLRDLVNSNIEIDPDQEYETRHDTSTIDYSSTYKGSAILKMREIGIEEYFAEIYLEQLTCFCPPDEKHAIFKKYFGGGGKQKK